MSVKAVFLDRDDTITIDPGFVTQPDQVKLAAGAAEAMKTLSEAGFLLVCVTNQSGIARGKLTEADLGVIHNELRRQLAQKGAKLDAIYHCPYHVEGTVPEFTQKSQLRKPQPGMLLKAAKELDIDLSASWMVGDRPADVEAGKRAGCKTIRVLTGKFGQNEMKTKADFTAANMTEAARIILAQRPKVKHPSSTPITRPEVLADVKEEKSDDKPQVSKAAEAAEVAEVKNTAQNIEDDASQVDIQQTGELNLTDSEKLTEMLLQLRQLVRLKQYDQFSLSKLIAGILQGLAAIAFVIGFAGFISAAGVDQPFWHSMGWLASAAVLQLATLTFYIMGNRS